MTKSRDELKTRSSDHKVVCNLGKEEFLLRSDSVKTVLSGDFSCIFPLEWKIFWNKIQLLGHVLQQSLSKEQFVPKPLLPTHRWYFHCTDDLVREMNDISLLATGVSLLKLLSGQEHLGSCRLCPGQPDSILFEIGLKHRKLHIWQIQTQLRLQSIQGTATPSQKPWGWERNSDAISPENCTAVDPNGNYNQKAIRHLLLNGKPKPTEYPPWQQNQCILFSGMACSKCKIQSMLEKQLSVWGGRSEGERIDCLLSVYFSFISWAENSTRGHMNVSGLLVSLAWFHD